MQWHEPCIARAPTLQYYYSTRTFTCASRLGCRQQYPLRCGQTESAHSSPPSHNLGSTHHNQHHATHTPACFLSCNLSPQADDLLAWSSNLDFSTYADEWTSLACTLGSEAYSVPIQEGGVLASLPPPSQDVRGAMVAAGVPLAPFKGGVSPAAGVTSGLNLVT